MADTENNPGNGGSGSRPSPSEQDTMVRKEVLTDLQWNVLIAATASAVLLFSVYCLSHGITTIFTNLYYFPIILAAYRYRYTGAGFAVLISLAYVLLVYAYFPASGDEIIGAWYRFLVFVGIAAVIAFLSDQRMRDQAQLQEKEERYRAFFSTSHDSVFISAPDGNWIDFNDAAVTLFGYESRNALFETKISELYARPVEREKYLQYIREHGYSQQYPVDFRRKDGTIISTVITSVARKDPRGNTISIQGTIWDITERKLAEERLNQQLQFIQQLIDTIPSPVFYKDVNGEYTGCNIAFENYIGLPRDRIIGRTAYQIAPRELAEKYTANDKELFDHPGTQIYESQVKYADGSIHDVIFYKATYTDMKGAVGGLVGIILDISARKRSEKALRESQSLLEEAMDQGRMAYWELDMATQTFTFNDRFYALYGTTAEKEGGYRIPAETYGRRFIHPDDIHLLNDEIAKALDSTDPRFHSETEHRIIRGDGELRYIVVRYRIIMDAAGRPVKTHGVNQDITERRRAEEALSSANQKLNTLSSITRHDILNKITGLRLILELTRETAGTPEMIQSIDKEEEIVEAITRQIEFTRYYQDIGVQAPVWHDAAAQIRAAAGQLALDRVDLVIEANGVEIYADGLIQKVFYNLMENSLRHGEHVTAMKFTFAEAEDRGILVYEDNGVGIRQDDKEKLFTRGFGKNTGLGLFLSREILSITGITITENGEPGRGARFEIRVPRDSYRFGGTTPSFLPR